MSGLIIIIALTTLYHCVVSHRIRVRSCECCKTKIFLKIKNVSQKISLSSRKHSVTTRERWKNKTTQAVCTKTVYGRGRRVGRANSRDCRTSISGPPNTPARFAVYEKSHETCQREKRHFQRPGGEIKRRVDRRRT